MLRVTMSGVMRAQVTRRPLTSPTAAPMARQRRVAGSIISG
jgi:hypothetical protein